MLPIAEQTDHKSMELMIERFGRMRLRASSKHGKVEHELPIDRHHPLVHTWVEPLLIKKAATYFDQWSITDHAIILRKVNKTILIAALGAHP